MFEAHESEAFTHRGIDADRTRVIEPIQCVILKWTATGWAPADSFLDPKLARPGFEWLDVALGSDRLMQTQQNVRGLASGNFAKPAKVRSMRLRGSGRLAFNTTNAGSGSSKYRCARSMRAPTA